MVLSEVLLHPQEFDGTTVIEPWRPLIGDQLQLLHISIFGNGFFVDALGRVWLLDSWTGELHGVSASYDEYRASVQHDAEFFRSWFLTDLAEALVGSGLNRTTGHVYAPFVSPGLGGTLAVENFSLAPVRAYVAVSAAEVLARRGA
jgi:hypothetical protein